MVGHWCCPSPGVFTGRLPEARLVQRSRVEDSIPCAWPPPEPASQESSQTHSRLRSSRRRSMVLSVCVLLVTSRSPKPVQVQGRRHRPSYLSGGEYQGICRTVFSLKALFFKKKKKSPISKDVLYHLCHRMSRHKCMDLSGGSCVGLERFICLA